MKKFIRDIYGGYVKVSSIECFYVSDIERCVRAQSNNHQFTLAECKSKEEAWQWLDNFMHELEDDSPTNSDIKERLADVSDVLGDIYQKLIGVADDDVISDFDTVLDELDDIIDDIKE